MRRPCIGCGTLIPAGSRCPACQRARPRGRRLQALRAAYVVGKPCAECGRPAEHLDHITPVILGGTDHATNLNRSAETATYGRAISSFSRKPQQGTSKSCPVPSLA